MRLVTAASWLVTLAIVLFAGYMALSSGHRLPAPSFMSQHEAWKTGHFAAFFSIAVSLSVSLRQTPGLERMKRRILWTGIVTFAILTETGQFFAFDHTSTVTDVLIDVAGGICGRNAYLWFRHKLAGS